MAVAPRRGSARGGRPRGMRSRTRRPSGSGVARGAASRAPPPCRPLPPARRRDQDGPHRCRRSGRRPPAPAGRAPPPGLAHRPRDAPRRRATPGRDGGPRRRRTACRGTAPPTRLGQKGCPEDCCFKRCFVAAERPVESRQRLFRIAGAHLGDGGRPVRRGKLNRRVRVGLLSEQESPFSRSGEEKERGGEDVRGGATKHVRDHGPDAESLHEARNAAGRPW